MLANAMPEIHKVNTALSTACWSWTGAQLSLGEVDKQGLDSGSKRVWPLVYTWPFLSLSFFFLTK